MKAAIYIDLDNMLGYCYSLGYEFRVSAIIDYIKAQGDELTLRRSFGSITSVLSHIGTFISETNILQELARNKVMHKDCTGKKNTTDLALSVDALTSIDKFEVVYLVSSDSDFSIVEEKLKDDKKKLVSIKMFVPCVPKAGDVFYPELLGLKVESNLDATALVYRNTLEQILRSSIADPVALTSIMRSVERNFKPGMSLAELANSIPDKGAFRVIRTAFFGRAFLSDSSDRETLLAIKGSVNELRSAYYRQCEFLLRRKLSKHHLDEAALNKTFLLSGEEHFSIASRSLEVV